MSVTSLTQLFFCVCVCVREMWEKKKEKEKTPRTVICLLNTDFSLFPVWRERQTSARFVTRALSTEPSRVFSWRETRIIGACPFDTSIDWWDSVPPFSWRISLSAWLSLRFNLTVLKHHSSWLVNASSPLQSFDLPSGDFPSTDHYHFCCQWLKSPMAAIASHLLKLMPPHHDRSDRAVPENWLTRNCYPPPPCI